VTEVLLDDLLFGEGPRWREGRLWFSDFFRHEVRAVTPAGEVENVACVPNQPSGLGWLPDGRLLIVSMTDRQVLRREPDGELVTHADLAALAPGDCNDLVVDEVGRAYVGNFGPSDGPGEPHGPTVLLLVQPDGTAEVAADDMAFPNGAVITPDGSTLIIGETFGERLTAFDIDRATGRLSNRRVWAPLPGVHPDGCCLDAAGGIWVANPPERECLRVVEGGEITDRVATRYPCIACMLGGDDGRTLYLLTSAWADQSVRTDDNAPFGMIEHTQLTHPHAGRP
jgi:sugar lactone lactonase YvrE